ncbi:MAG: CoA transferase [Henriciella sp.]
MRLLNNVRIIAVEQYGAGPYGSMLLAELGAEVVKIEAPSMGGDISRKVGPHFLGENDSLFYQSFCRSKKSVSLELKTGEGRAAFEDLVKSADAVVNNLRGNQPEKLGLTYEDLKSVNPAIVCAHLSAYGRDNERADWPGYDYLMQAEAGFLSVTGEPDSPPTRFGLSMIDYMAGAQMALGCVSAILNAKQTGEGCDVDVCLFDIAIHQLSYPALWALNAGDVIGRHPRGAHPSLVPSQSVTTKDGWGFIMCQTDKFWLALCECIDRPELSQDERFETMAKRRENRDALTPILDQAFRERTASEWVPILAGKVPYAPVHDLKTALENPFVHDIGMIDEVDHPHTETGKLSMLASPIKVNGKRPAGRRAPSLGEHNEDILKA